ncbi:MAG: hypothetical protein IAX22_07490 [Candidatus Bathyarchaeota archaeon]|nr:hypothetical protein [Candidatus Bathyarchaeota archaeon]
MKFLLKYYFYIRHDPLSFVIQHGLPVIGSSVGHLSEEIRQMQDGILLNPRDVKGFAKAMIHSKNTDLAEKAKKAPIKPLNSLAPYSLFLLKS